MKKLQASSLLIVGFFVTASICLPSSTTPLPHSFNSIPSVSQLDTAAEPLYTPSGIFSLQPQQNAYDSQSNYDDIDIYVPYRSDELDYFSLELLKLVLDEQHQQNIIISPFSVKLVLAILAEAAGNNTQTQKELIGHMTEIRSPDNLRGFYKKILTSLKMPNPYLTLNLETKLYADAFIEPQQRYAALLRTFYDTDIESLQFKDSRNAANSINSWINNVTNGHLTELINEENLRDKVMLMINAIYFKGKWRRQFNETFQSAFFRNPQQQIKADFMELTEYFYYYESKEIEMNTKIVRLPYQGKKFSMFIMLPNQQTNVNDLAKTIQSKEIKRMQWLMEETKVKVTIPKFKFDMKKPLKGTLNKMGIHEIFTDSASLPGLARGALIAGQLKVSDIYQKSGIEVNELGTEAFAATVVEIENKFGGSTEIAEFNANRPFVFFIEEEATGNIIFAGKVVEPL